MPRFIGRRARARALCLFVASSRGDPNGNGNGWVSLSTMVTLASMPDAQNDRRSIEINWICARHEARRSRRWRQRLQLDLAGPWTTLFPVYARDVFQHKLRIYSYDMGGKKALSKNRNIKFIFICAKCPRNNPPKKSIANSSKRLVKFPLPFSSFPIPLRLSHDMRSAEFFAKVMNFPLFLWFLLYCTCIFLLAKILVFVLAMPAHRDYHRGCWGWKQHRRLTPEVLIAGKADKFIKARACPMWGCAYKMLVINHAVLCEFKHLNRINITIFKSL